MGEGLERILGGVGLWGIFLGGIVLCFSYSLYKDEVDEIRRLNKKSISTKEELIAYKSDYRAFSEVYPILTKTMKVSGSILVGGIVSRITGEILKSRREKSEEKLKEERDREWNKNNPPRNEPLIIYSPWTITSYWISSGIISPEEVYGETPEGNEWSKENPPCSEDYYY